MINEKQFKYELKQLLLMFLGFILGNVFYFVFLALILGIGFFSLKLFNLPITQVTLMVSAIVIMFTLAFFHDRKQKQKIINIATELTKTNFFEFFSNKKTIINLKSDKSIKIIFCPDGETIRMDFPSFENTKFIITANDSYHANFNLLGVDNQSNREEVLKSIFIIKPKKIINEPTYHNILNLIEGILKFDFFTKVKNTKLKMRIEFKISMDNIDSSNIDHFSSKFLELSRFLNENGKKV